MTRLRRIAWVAGIALAGAVVGASPSSAYFETMEVGARGVALGKTHVALADDASAVHWNPGGLPFLDRGQVILAQYRPHQAMDLATHFAAVSLPVGRMSMWSAWSHTGVPDAVSEDMLYAGAGTVLRWRQVRIGVGANVKLARVAYHSPAATASGELSGLGSETRAAFDAGVLAILNPRLRVGAVVRSIGRPSFEFVPGGGATGLRVEREAGVSWRWHPESAVAAAVIGDEDGRPTPVVGAEVVFHRVFALRVGMGDLKYFGGVGIMSDRWVVDLAFSTHNTLGISSMASVVIPFGRARE